jgi:WS/DGAT/MGAT family acyltransferase
MTRMRAMDAAFLAMERPGELRHLGSVSIFGPGTSGPLTYEVVRALVEERLDLIASAQRVVVDVPLGLGRPSWGAVEGFDLEFHVRHDTVPPPGGSVALAELVARIHALPLDRTRPLWELWVIDGLADGQVALYAKMHIAAIDDVTGAEVMTALLDPDPDGVRRRMPAPTVAPAGVLGRLFGSTADQLRQAAGFPGRLANRAVHELGGQLAGLGGTLVEAVQRTPGLDPVARLLPAPDDGDAVDAARAVGRAPRVSWNAPVTPHRRFATTRLSLETIVAVKRAAGTTVNDVVVAVCAGALRHWLHARDELPTSPLVALVPMLVGGAERDDAHVAGLVVTLPTNVPAPGERLRRASDALRTAQQRRAAVPASLMQDVSMFAPPALCALAGRLVGALPYRGVVSPTVNLAITNVPGSRQALHVAGRPLEASYPVLTINQLSPLHIGLQSCGEWIGVGAVACRDTMEDLAALVDRMPVELELLAAATRRGPGAAATTTRRRRTP